MLTEKQKERRADKLRALPIFDRILSDTSPSISNLEKLISINEQKSNFLLNKHQTRALQLKHKALTTNLTIIEKTMTIEQLCESNNCLWVKEIPIKNLIFYFIYKERGLSNINALHKCQSPFIFKIDPPQTRFLK